MERKRRTITFKVVLSAVDDLYPKDQLRLAGVKKPMMEGTVEDFKRFLYREVKGDEVISGASGVGQET